MNTLIVYLFQRVWMPYGRDIYSVPEWTLRARGLTVLIELLIWVFFKTIYLYNILLIVFFNVLYLHLFLCQKVQQKHHRCHRRYSYPRCSCAVAVRSGKDVFIVDICNYNAIINFPSCGDKVLKVIKVNDRNYKVKLVFLLIGSIAFKKEVLYVFG